MEKLRLIQFLILFVLFVSPLASQAEVLDCHAHLKPFARDCQIQFEWNNLKNQFQAKLNTPIDEIAEYKALRFIDRTSWQFAKVKPPQKNISDIYEPKNTWEHWNRGIDLMMGKYANLPNALRSDESFVQMLTEINHQLLLEPTARKPVRDYKSTQVGFCETLSQRKMEQLEQSRESMEIYQNEWNLRFQTTLAKIVRSENGLAPSSSKFGGEVFESPHLGPSCSEFNTNGQRQMWVGFTSAYKVKNQLSWLRIFLKWNLQKIQANDPNAISPIELGAVVQKWFISIHPFVDGNGRTSRALQDLIHQYFKLPAVPSGDLQDDIYTNVFEYIDHTYLMTDKMLKKMNGCYQQRISNQWKNEFEKYACQSLRNGKML